MLESLCHCPEGDFWQETRSKVYTGGSGLHSSAFSHQEVALDKCPATRRQLGKERGGGHTVELQQQQPTLSFKLSWVFEIGGRSVGTSWNTLWELQWEQLLLTGTSEGAACSQQCLRHTGRVRAKWSWFADGMAYKQIPYPHLFPYSSLLGGKVISSTCFLANTARNCGALRFLPSRDLPKQKEERHIEDMMAVTSWWWTWSSPNIPADSLLVCFSSTDAEMVDGKAALLGLSGLYLVSIHLKSQ